MGLPFKPIVYRNYFECFNGIYSQGPLGFYKGNGVRALHALIFHRANCDLNGWSEAAFPEQVKQLKQIPCAQEFLLACGINLLLHPLHLAEARLIIQNRRPHFSAYKNVSQVFTRTPGELMRGIMMHIPRNVFLALSKYYFIFIHSTSLFTLQLASASRRK